MKPEDKELFRNAILCILNANRTRFGLSAAATCATLVQFGFRASQFGGPEAFHELVAEQLEYLSDKQLLVEVSKPISPENRVWKITPAGIAHVDERT